MTYNFLFVDDEPDVQEIYGIFLKSLLGKDFKFHFFMNGRQCLDYLETVKDENREDRFLIFSDINMPVMDGFTMLRAVMNQYENIEVALTSAYDSNEYKEKGYNLGAIDFIPKPVDFAKIAELINERRVK